MSARIFIIAYAVITLVYEAFTSVLSDIQRRRPLPEEVADIYEPERYRTYLARVADFKRSDIVFNALNLIIDILLVLSPVYRLIENVCRQNPYAVLIVTYVLIWIISTAIGSAHKYYETFHIEEKYGLNHKDMREFVREAALTDGLELVLMIALSFFIVFVGENLSSWTAGFSIGFLRSLLLCAAIGAAMLLLLQLLKGISLLVMKIQYSMSPLPDGDLRDRINALQESSPKKVKKIYEYNESKKSPRKNAFLLKFLWIREFGIADNFLNENDEDELLAVLSHEIGHLKHKKNALDYIGYGIWGLWLLAAAAMISHPGIILAVNEWTRSSFDLTVNNYYILIIMFSDIVKPLLFLHGVFGTYKTRTEEYEADREAVANGYGEALITTFKVLSSDELVNVNPHPIIEFLEYDHPGMYRRIKAIRDNTR